MMKSFGAFGMESAKSSKKDVTPIRKIGGGGNNMANFDELPSNSDLSPKLNDV
jgi:hypothetical protein